MSTKNITKAQLETTITLLTKENEELKALLVNKQAEIDLLKMQVSALEMDLIDTSMKLNQLKEEKHVVDQVNAELSSRPFKQLKPLQQQLWSLCSGKEPIHHLWYEVHVMMTTDDAFQLGFQKDFYFENKEECFKFLSFVKQQMVKLGCSFIWNSDSLTIKRPVEPTESNEPTI